MVTHSAMTSACLVIRANHPSRSVRKLRILQVLASSRKFLLGSRRLASSVGVVYKFPMNWVRRGNLRLFHTGNFNWMVARVLTSCANPARSNSFFHLGSSASGIGYRSSTHNYACMGTDGRYMNRCQWGTTNHRAPERFSLLTRINTFPFLSSKGYPVVTKRMSCRKK